jgi:DNA-binding CsgD family transcriptional regulator
MEQARVNGNAMAVDIWSTINGMVNLAAGRLTAARTAVESLPSPEQAGATELDMMRMVVLAEVALRTDDRNLLQQMVVLAQDAYARGAALVRRTAAYVLALAAWYHGDLHEAVRWFGGDVEIFGVPLTPEALDQVILSARVAAAAGDAGCHVYVLRAIEKMQQETPAAPLFAAVALYARGILQQDVQVLVEAAGVLESMQRPLLYAAAAEDAGAQLLAAGRDAEALAQLNAAFDTYGRCEAVADARRVGRQLRRLGVERRIVSSRARSGWGSLTDAEVKVVRLVARGATNPAVADQLHLSLHTVKTHVHNAFGKLGVTSRSQLAQSCRQEGRVPTA